jgi:LPS-assembly protein
MSKLVALISGPLFSLLPLLAQEQQPILPEPILPPGVDSITPVPLPEIKFGAQVEGMATLPENVKLENKGGKIEGDLKTGVRYSGPVVLHGDNGLEIFANTAIWDSVAKTIVFEGDVSVYQGNVLQRGDRTVYFYETQKVDTEGLRAGIDPIYMESGKFRAETVNGKQVFVGEDAGITTDDSEDPDYWIRARETRIYPNEKIVFKNLRLYAGDTPVFWLPYLSQPLDSELGYHFTPGARSNWGPYLLNSYGIMLGGEVDEKTGERENAWLLSQWRFDIRASRGIGTGVDLQSLESKKNENLHGLSFYYLNDLDPNKTRSGVERGFVNEDRYRLSLKERLNFTMPDKATWYADANLTYLSDAYYLEDFDPSGDNKDPYPDNILGVYRRDEKSLLSLFGRFQLNDFYRTDTRYPEIAFDQARGPLFNTDVLHEGTTSFDIMGDKTSDLRRGSVIEPLLDLPVGDPGETRLINQLTGYERILAQRIRDYQAAGDPRAEALRAQLLDTGFTRFHTYQDFSLPLNFGGWLTVVPHAGVGYTRYDSVEGPADSFDRTIGSLGAEASLKFSKDLGGYQNKAWGLDGLLHVIQPYANWSLVSADDLDESHPRIDRLTYSTRPRPLSLNRYTAIDDIDNWNTVRLGTRNTLITKRDNQSLQWLTMDTYIDAFIDQQSRDQDVDSTFSNLYNDIQWNPLPWMGVAFETQFPIIDGGSGFTEFASSLRFQATENFEFSVGYRHLDNHPVLVDSNRVDLTTYTRLAENWGVGTRHTLEMDDGTLELQQYTLHRDLGKWVVGVGVTHRDNRLKDEFGVMFSLTLRDLPSASLPFTLDAE